MDVYPQRSKEEEARSLQIANRCSVKMQKQPLLKHSTLDHPGKAHHEVLVTRIIGFYARSRDQSRSIELRVLAIRPHELA